MPTLYVQDTFHEFYSGKKSYATGLSTLHHHCSYLGPTIKVKRGDVVDFSIVNLRSEAVTNHWHGLHIPGRLDGGPHQMIQPGKAWNITMPIDQEAATCWYHDHTCEKTAEQVYFGHAGMFVVEDDNSGSLGLPDIYGVNDIPLVIQDKLLNSHGEQIYDLRGGPIFLGDDITVNGTLNSVCFVTPGLVRFRLLNAANDRQFKLYFKDGRSFYVIASDGGFLNKPISVTDLTLYSGERAEVVIDFTRNKGEMFDLFATILGRNPGDEDLSLLVMKLVVNNQISPFSLLPKTLRTSWVNWEEVVESAPNVSRKFSMSLSRNSTEGYINDEKFNMNKVNESVPIGIPEVWEVISVVGNHPFHVHGCSFLILDVDGKPPAEEFRGWKDSVVVPVPNRDVPGEIKKSKILVKFNHDTYKKNSKDQRGKEYSNNIEFHIPYMYHCHKLHHEDIGMMGQFTVYHEKD